MLSPIPKSEGKRRSLAVVFNAQINEEDMSMTMLRLIAKSSSNKLLSVDYLAAKISTKLEEGDFNGTVRLACSEDTFAEPSDATYAALWEKHSTPPFDSSLPLPPTQAGGLHVSGPKLSRQSCHFPVVLRVVPMG